MTKRARKRIMLAAVLLLAAVALASCVPGDGNYDAENPAGFWWGIWHGSIVVITFFMGLFTGGEYTIYEAFNTGWSYNLGFLLGMGIYGGGIGGIVRIGGKD